VETMGHIRATQRNGRQGLCWDGTETDFGARAELERAARRAFSGFTRTWPSGRQGDSAEGEVGAISAG